MYVIYCAVYMYVLYILIRTKIVTLSLSLAKVIELNASVYN